MGGRAREDGPGGPLRTGQRSCPSAGQRKGLQGARDAPEQPLGLQEAHSSGSRRGHPGSTLTQWSTGCPAPDATQMLCGRNPSSATSLQPRRDAAPGCLRREQPHRDWRGGSKAPLSQRDRTDAGYKIQVSGSHLSSRSPHPSPEPLAPSAESSTEEQHGGAARAVCTQRGRPWLRPWKALRSALPEQLCEKRPSYFPRAAAPPAAGLCRGTNSSGEARASLKGALFCSLAGRRGMPGAALTAVLRHSPPRNCAAFIS